MNDKVVKHFGVLGMHWGRRKGPSKYPAFPKRGETKYRAFQKDNLQNIRLFQRKQSKLLERNTPF